MKTVLVLGAGMVSRPLVHYLLERGYRVTLCDINAAQARSVIEDHPHGKALELDIADEDTVKGLINEADLVISLLPPKMHPGMARFALDAGKNFMTASYLSEEMEAMADEVEERDLIFLNEVGLDPGLDHMTAMEIIDRLKKEGYSILGFDSHCGGIPSRKAANNPLRYKLSWSPQGVLGAITRASKYRRDNELLVVPGKDKLRHAEVLHVPGAGIFESNPNADSLYYGKRYGLENAVTVRRGTLRYPGWARFWLFMISMGFIEREPEMEFEDEQVLDALLKLNLMEPPVHIYSFIVEKAEANASVFLEAMVSLGLLKPDNRITGTYSAFDIILKCMQETMQYDSDERDLVVLHHEFLAEKAGTREMWTSTLIREGDDQTTAMAFLVGVPAAIAARLILENKITSRGVLIPLEEELYAPILRELGELGLPHKIEVSPYQE
ncbi:MAG: saccharopine dehydrogenase C-terminal domain-containing protein [Acidobacteriota bacterium]|nr:saccharopine dehydrogenase C-terminal domain-containing protein [Acidobacteriota bacterium]